MPKHVLIIEDDVIVASVYQRFLQAHGFTTEIARDGQAGLERIVETAVDAVLLDLMMPRVNGITALQSLRADERFRALPIIVLTAAAVPALVQQALDSGANRVFDKANDKPLAIVNVLHDLLRTSSDSQLVPVTKSGNPDAVLDHWPARRETPKSNAQPVGRVL